MANANIPLGIDNVLLPVGDLRTAVEFYTKVLGFTLKFQLDEQGVAVLKMGKETPGLLLRRTEESDIASSAGERQKVWVEVKDARQFAETLQQQGVALLAEPFEVATGSTVEVADPWGNVLGFTDYTKRPQLGRR